IRRPRSPTPPASLIGSAGSAASWPRPRYFQSASVNSAGASASANGTSARHLRTRYSSAGANRKIEFDGLIAIAYPAARPAAAAEYQPDESRERRQKYAATSSATVDGKSGTEERPRNCGSVSSVYFWW